MSTTSNGGSEQPLTRKQMRELAAAQASQQDTPPPTVATAPSLPVPTPPAPAAQPPFAPPVRSTQPRATGPHTPSVTSQPQAAAPQPRAVAPQSRPAVSQAPAQQNPAPTRSAGPPRVSAATRIANGAGPTSEQARRAPASAVVPANLQFAPDVFSAQSGATQADASVTRRSIHQTPAAPLRTRQGSQPFAPGAQGAPSGQTANVPDVVPPSQTSAIRRIDETGEMSTITATGMAVPEAEVAATVTRKSIWVQRSKEKAQDGATGTDSVAIPVLPALEVEPPAIVDLSVAERAEVAEQDTAMMMAIAAEIPPKDDDLAPVADSSEAETTVLSPVAGPVWAAQPAVTPAEDLPDWSDITSLDSELPTDSLPAGAPVVLDPALVPVAGEMTGEFAPVDAITDDAEPIVELDHSYTWLHYLILIAIAVVLGMVVWKVGLDPKNEKPQEPEPQSLQYSVSQTML
ncbi:hypothetical protein V5R04_09500 [Jonesiaceae bacterium BS-20]|uniref:Uncharacterized protein n=1 Tax=Jonesiaceae bacterium BS-20 TaxID=3120821 RepID=A0AAU7DTS0_9MICO